MTHKIIITLPKELTSENDPDGVLLALKRAEHPWSKVFDCPADLPFELELIYQSENLRELMRSTPARELLSLSAAGCVLRFLHPDNAPATVFVPAHQILSLSNAGEDWVESCRIAHVAVIGVSANGDDEALDA